MAILGTRPEAIKLCPLILELRKRKKYQITVCSTGQHRQMLDPALAIFGIKPDIDLSLMQEGQTLSSLVSRIFASLEKVVAAVHPDLILVQGDTATAFAGALSGFYEGIPVAHVEAGLRTHRIENPYPEEFHRCAISTVADYHFAPTVTAKKNLMREGISEKNIFITGNTVIDALRYTLKKNVPMPISYPNGMRGIIFTAHRRESQGEEMAGMFRALYRLVEEYPDIYAICPLHYSPEVRASAAIINGHPRISVIEPPDILTFHHLLSKTYLVMTDSGGIQEEAAALGIPTVVMRYATERPEGILRGVLRLAGSHEESIVEIAGKLLERNSEEYQRIKKPSAVYGDGNASRRIADILEKHF